MKMRNLEKQAIGGQNGGLDQLVNMIDGKDKNINAYEKTKLDWDKYAKDSKQEAAFEKNRKDGYLAK